MSNPHDRQFETAAQLESEILTRGYTIARVYDESKGLCAVDIVNSTKTSSIKAKNTSRQPMWKAYRAALRAALAQMDAFEAAEKRQF